jgi:ubiquinone/menaquinone biosynthesis C-methylase UbiE
LNLAKNVISVYQKADEPGRLLEPLGQLEFERSKDIIKRYLSPPPALVLDVGGGSGPYSRWLAGRGYDVHLIDPVPRLVEEARRASRNQPEAPIKSFRVGDARDLDFADSKADGILMFGPLYHLVRRSDRIKALLEARRVLKKKGLLFAVGISRFASVIDGLVRGYIADPAFVKVVAKDLQTGQHRNPTENPAYFTDAFFHRPHELGQEVEAAGFQVLKLVSIEGFGYCVPDLEPYWRNPAHRQAFLETLRKIEEEPSLLGLGPHLMAIGQKRSVSHSRRKAAA